MKQYKLIKEYPGSWKKDTIVEFDKNSDRCLINGVKSPITAMQVLNYPDYWQEITKPEYTILSFKVPGNDHWRAELEHNGMCGGWSQQHADSQLLKGIWSIWKVRRESDGEIFQIGDTIQGINKDHIKTITGFRIETKGMFINTDGWVDCSLKHCTKVKPKEWEITGLRSKNTGQIYHTPCDYMSINLKLILNHKDIPTIRDNEIYSVKRLSDNLTP